MIDTLLLAAALSVDSLVVSTATALRHHLDLRNGILMAFVFALCQSLFPLGGALIGDAARSVIESIDHWIAFLLLCGVGGKMIADGIRGEEASLPANWNGTLLTYLLLGIATSIDALAVGIGLGLQYPLHEVLRMVAVIGAVTLIASLVGVMLGKQRIALPERAATILAGVVLIGLGVKILLTHLFA